MADHLLSRRSLLLFAIGCMCIAAQAQLAPACFILTVSPQATGTNPRGICAADLNYDGRADIATANAGSNNISVIISTATGFSTATNYSAGGSPQGICVADFNLDLLLDLAVVNFATNNVTIFIRTGSGTYTVSGTFNVGAGPTSVCSGDFNFDARDDIAVCNSGGNNISVLLGNGSGSLLPAVNYTAGSQPYCIRTADLNGDNSLDLVTANSNGNNISVLMGNGSGAFGSPANYGVGNQPYSLQIAHLNNDTYRDIVVANVLSGDVSILLGSSSGTFASAVNYTTGINPYSVDVADFNLDGKADLTTANYSSAQMSVLLGYGMGSFTPPATYTTGLNPAGIAAADFNQDGKADIAVADYGSNTAHIYLNGVPSISVSPSGTVCSGNNFTLSALGTVSFSWSTGSTTGSIVVSPTVTTSYTVTGIATGGCSNLVVRTISVLALPTVSVNSGTICSGKSFTITPSGAGSYVITGGSNIVSPSTTTQYTVVGTSAAGCTSTNTAISTVSVNPSPTVTLNSGTVCPGNSFTLISSGAATYTLSSGSSVVTPSSTTSYSVTGNSTAGCVSANTAVASVSVALPPVITIISLPPAICNGDSAVLTAYGASTYTWGGTQTGTSIVVSPLLNNTSYTVIGTSAAGCTNTSVKIVTVHLLPNVSIAPGTWSLCTGGTVALSGQGAQNYFWSGGIINNVVFSPTASAIYTLTGVDQDGCKNTAVAGVTVYPLPAVIINGGKDTLCAGSTATLSATGGGSYSWSTGSHSAQISIKPASSTVYSVTVTSIMGCNSASAVLIIVDACQGIKINGDESRILVFPNPSHGSFSVLTDSHISFGSLRLFDLWGRVCEIRALNEKQTTMRTDHLTPGIYLLVIYSEEKPVHFMKLVIAE